MVRCFVVGVGAVVLGVAGGSVQGQVFNASFELEGVEPGMVPEWDGWAEKLTAGDTGITPTDGAWAVALGSGFALWQSGVELQAGDRLLVDVFSNPFGVESLGEDAAFTVWLSHSGAYEDRDASNQFALLEHEGTWSTLDLVAPQAGTFTLYFEQTGGAGEEYDRYALVDNVRLAPVPTPGTAGLFAVAGLVAGRRRRGA